MIDAFIFFFLQGIAIVTHNTDLYMEMMLKKFSSSDVEETKYPYNGVDP